MFGKAKEWICFALTALAVSASASIPKFQPLEKSGAVFPMVGKTSASTEPFARSVPFCGQLSFAYDSMNRLTVSTQSVYSVSSVVQNSYDLNGNRTNIVYPGGLNVSYRYDEEDRLIGVTTEYAENKELTRQPTALTVPTC